MIPSQRERRERKEKIPELDERKKERSERALSVFELESRVVGATGGQTRRERAWRERI